MQMGNVVKGHRFVKARGVPWQQHLVTKGLPLGNKKLEQIKANISATEPHHGLGVVYSKPNKNNAEVHWHSHKGHYHGKRYAFALVSAKINVEGAGAAPLETVQGAHLAAGTDPCCLDRDTGPIGAHCFLADEGLLLARDDKVARGQSHKARRAAKELGLALLQIAKGGANHTGDRAEQVVGVLAVEDHGIVFADELVHNVHVEANGVGELALQGLRGPQGIDTVVRVAHRRGIKDRV